MGAPGFDNAPIVAIERGEPKKIQFVYPYYENPKFFVKQLAIWATYPKELLDNLSIIVVDDGSPENSARDAIIFARSVLGMTLTFSLRLFRIEVDVRWNWLAARNIGMYQSEDGWCILTDMDHMIEARVLDSVMHGKHDEDMIYRFSRREHSGMSIHPHPNSMLMTKKMFWKVGGYDERLSGFYGTDGDWRRRCAATAPIATLHEELVRYEHQDDSSTVKYLRKQPQDARKKPILQLRKNVPNWRPKTLSFPYHEESLHA